jgi:hypothetical protein
MRKFGFMLVAKIAVPIIFIVFAATFMLYPLRNSNSWEIAERFLRNSELIKGEAGEIIEIRGLSPDLTYRSEQIAKGLKNGESLSDINKKLAAEKIELIIKRDDYFAETCKINGSKRTIEFQIYFKKHQWFDRDIYYYVIKEAFYRDEAGNWHNIPIGWFDNYALLFKKTGRAEN